WCDHRQNSVTVPPPSRPPVPSCHTKCHLLFPLEATSWLLSAARKSISLRIPSLGTLALDKTLKRLANVWPSPSSAMLDNRMICALLGHTDQ
ncbi:hypothetical protein BaRGS_00017032, partial [Batillaria attramentaria]